MITIKTTIATNKLNDFLETVYKTSKSEPNLSPRSRVELKKAYDESRLLIALDGEKPIGWLMLVPYSNNVQELATGFIKEKYRSKGVFTQLIKTAIVGTRISLTVTFNKSLYNHLIKIGFKNSSLWDAIKLSNGKFILSRLNLLRLKAINSHYQTSKPGYLICKRYE